MENLNNESQNTDKKKIKKFLNDYDRLHKELLTNLVYLVLPRPNIFKTSPLQDSKFLLRDSIIYRSGSIRFHLDLLFLIKSSIEKRVSLDLSKFNDLPSIVQGTENTLQIFDDIIFHICSMFDYLGNLIGLLYYGEHKMRLKWNGLLDSIRDRNNKLSKTSIAPQCKQTNKELVDPLFNYRGRLIHYKKDKARGSQRISLNKEFANIDFNVGFPIMLKNSLKIKCLKDIKFGNQEEVNIHEIAIILSLDSIKRVIEIIKAIPPNSTIKC